jgi:hypothetical protein
MDIEATKDFDSKAVNGARVVIATGDGFAQVKLDLDNVRDLNPQPYDNVAWLVRYGAYANKERGSDAATTCRYVGDVSPGFVDRLHSGATSKKAA